MDLAGYQVAAASARISEPPPGAGTTAVSSSASWMPAGSARGSKLTLSMLMSPASVSRPEDNWRIPGGQWPLRNAYTAVMGWRSRNSRWMPAVSVRALPVCGWRSKAGSTRSRTGRAPGGRTRRDSSRLASACAPAREPAVGPESLPGRALAVAAGAVPPRAGMSAARVAQPARVNAAVVVTAMTMTPLARTPETAGTAGPVCPMPEPPAGEPALTSRAGLTSQRRRPCQLGRTLRCGGSSRARKLQTS